MNLLNYIFKKLKFFFFEFLHMYFFSNKRWMEKMIYFNQFHQGQIFPDNAFCSKWIFNNTTRILFFWRFHVCIVVIWIYALHQSALIKMNLENYGSVYHFYPEDIQRCNLLLKPNSWKSSQVLYFFDHIK